MNTSKFRKNSQIHQALNVIAFLPTNETDLRKKINFTSSKQRFIDNIITPLISAGYAYHDESVYKITELGKDLLDYLGSIKTKLASTTKVVSCDIYDGKDTTKPCVRISGEDHFKYPSRRGNMLFYRDGRVETV